MLTLIEKIIFAIAVIASLAITYQTFTKMGLIILRGQGRLAFDKLPERAWTGFTALMNQGEIIRHRTVTSLLHLALAWGFIFYFLVNAFDVLEGYIPGFRIPGPVGDIYRLLADLLSVAVLVGVAYFLLRRFGTGDKALTTRDNVLLHPKAREGIRRDSLLVGGFILAHVGFRFLGASFLIADHGPDAWQPFANLVALLWSGLSPVCDHHRLARKLVGCIGADFGLPALLPLHQARPPLHGAVQLRRQT